MIHDKAYQDWKNHKCNENQIERMDNLNKKYMDDISSSANTSKESSFLSNDIYNGVNANSELNAGVVQDLNNSTDETFDVENPLVNDTSHMPNVAEAANSNISNSNIPLNESSSLNNADATTNSQHESQSTLLAANLTPPSATQAAPIVQSHTRGVYNCTPSTISTQGKTVTPGEQKSNPYKCDYCPKSYQTKYSLNRHQKVHATSKVKIPATTTTTTYNKPKLNMPPLMAIDGLPPNVNSLPLDSSDDNVNQNQTKFDFKKPPIKKNIKKFYKPQPQSSIVTRNGSRRNKRNFDVLVGDDDDDDDDKEVPPPKAIKIKKRYRGGGNFYSSWD